MYERFYPAPAQTGATASFAWVTWLILASTIAVFLLQLYGLHGQDDPVGDALAFSPQAWNGNSPWTVVTYAWVHATTMFGSPNYFWVHITFNMFVLVGLGPALEQILGHLSFLILYLGGAIAAALVWLGCSVYGADDPSLIGASGALFAVIAGLGAAGPRVEVTFFLFFFMPLQMRAGTVAIVTCVIEVLSLPFPSGIAHWAHVGGALFGFFYVLIFYQLFGRSYLSN